MLRTITWAATFFILQFPFNASGQNLGLPFGNPAYDIADRLEILTGFDAGYHSAIKPYLRADLVELALKVREGEPDQRTWEDIQYIFDDNNEFVLALTRDGEGQAAYVDSTRTFYILSPSDQEAYTGIYTESKTPLFNTFYRTPANLFQVDTKDFYLRVNPILDLRYGRDLEEEQHLFYNRRGISLRGGIGHKVYFSTRIIETQARFANYVNAFEAEFRALPHAGLYKKYRSSVFDLDDSRDFLLADGYVGFDLTKQIGIQLGHGRQFLGDGMRSLLLSDFSPEYFYLKFNTRVWKLHYQNIFAELAAEGVFDQPSSQIVEKKYLAAHYLSFKPAENISLGLYEAIVFFREKGGFELQYLNPIILYRSIEGNLGSPDNALIGFTARWDLLNRISLYGQFVLDDIQIRRVLDGEIGWWGNKFGGQIGFKYINAFNIDHLDLQAEVNQVRPYTYSHRDSTSSYAHFNQALAHPNGANFKEFILKATYAPTARIRMQAIAVFLDTGEDPDGSNYGSSIVKENITRIGDFDMFTGQGIETNVSTLFLEASYALRHNLWLDIRMHHRSKESEEELRDLRTFYLMAGLRMNIGSQTLIF